MSAPATLPFISVEEYLESEQDGAIRHEYVAGRAYAMTGGSIYHNRITLTFASHLRSRVPKGCDVFASDMKLQTQHAFYYPDVMVHCDPADTDPYTKHRPLLIAEVISPNTRSTDEREKRAAYLGLDSLREYLLAEQDRAELRVIRRGDEGGWTELIYGPDDVVHLNTLDLDIAMQHIYRGPGAES